VCVRVGSPLGVRGADQAWRRPRTCRRWGGRDEGVQGLLMTIPVTFRMVVFRPFKGEILQATIAKINKDGIQRTLSSQPRRLLRAPPVVGDWLPTLTIGSEGRLLQRHMGATLRPLPGNAIVSLLHLSSSLH
jgi:hypothetical protein